MDITTANEVMACLSTDRTLFYYYKDRYSIGLLRQYAQQRNGVEISEIKKSAFAALMQKPRVKSVLAQLGNQKLDSSFLYVHDYDVAQTAHTLTLGTWGSDRGGWRYNQTSRRGYNLVLQLNFNRQHEQQYQQLKTQHSLFNYSSHPVSANRNTMAWARIDFDWSSSTALIEEVQSDWIRNVVKFKARCLIRLRHHHTDPSIETKIYAIKSPISDAIAYCDYILSLYQDIWAEAMLWAAVDFIFSEIGIKQIYYHTEQSGQLLKNIGQRAPPQSIYTDLPRKFCFSMTTELPDVIAGDKHVQRILRKHPDIKMQKLTLN